jgi:hypothetical protein
MRKTCLTGGVVFLVGMSLFPQNTTPLPAPADVTLTLSTEGDRHQFHLGELIPVKFSYSAAVPGKYVWVSQNTKLPGGHGLDFACSPFAESARPTPFVLGANDKFGEMLMAPCAGVGGGFGGACGDCDGERPLSTTAINFGPVPLNKYVRFRNGGAYTCIASSADVTTASAEDSLRAALLVRSNPLGFTVVDDPVWAHSVAASYAETYDKLCHGNDVPEQRRSQCFDIAGRVTYLDTIDSLAAEVKFFDGRNHGWDNGFWEAISETSYPADAVRLMTNRVQDPDVEVSTSTLESLASWDLRIESPDAFETGSPTNYHLQAVETLRKYVRLLGSSLSRKSSKTLPESAKTYRTFAGQEYCEGQALISKDEQDEVLAVPGLRP